MADVDAIARLLEVGANAVFLVILWRLYQDFVTDMRFERVYLHKLIERLLPDEEPPSVYRPSVADMYSRTPTNLGERAER